MSLAYVRCKRLDRRCLVTAILAIEILSINNKNLLKKLINYRMEMKEQILNKDKKLNKIGYQRYLKEMNK